MTKIDNYLPSANKGLIFILILSALMAFTSLSTDIYLPAMPVMAKSLHGDAELTVTGFLIGFAIAQLVWGPISDQLGRRLPLIFGMVFFVIGSVGCALSADMKEIVFWRIFQAIGACTGPMLARAMVRDLYTRTRAAQMLSTLIIVMAIAPIAGPLIGGQIITITAWPSIFWLLALIGIMMLASLFWLPETHPPEKRVKASLKDSFSNYLTLFKNKSFMRFTWCVTLYYTAAYAFIVGSPSVYINYYGISPQHYGWLFAINIVGVVLISTLNKKMVEKIQLEKLLECSTLVAFVMVSALCISLILHPTELIVKVICILVFFSMNGVIAATATACALDKAEGMTGSASALIGSMQYGSGIISTLLLAWFHNGTPWPMVVIMSMFTLLSFLVVFTHKRDVGHAEN